MTDTLVHVEGLSYQEMIDYYKEKSPRIKEGVVPLISSQYGVPIEIIRKDLELKFQDRIKPISQIYSEYINYCEKTKYFFRMRCLDDVIEGARPGEFVVIAGRTGTGKTALIGTLISQMLENNYNILFFSLEMKASRIFERLACGYLRLKRRELEKLVLLGLSETKLRVLLEKYNNLLIYDKGSLNIEELDLVLAESEDLMENKIDVIFIDYLGLLRVIGKKTSYETMSALSKATVDFAKRNEVLTIAAVQCNRTAEGKPIEKSHLRGSGEIEEDADIILGLWRDISSEREKLKSRENLGLIEVYLRVLKNRSGQAGNEFSLVFDAPYFLFSEEPFEV